MSINFGRVLLLNKLRYRLLFGLIRNSLKLLVVVASLVEKQY